MTIKPWHHAIRRAASRHLGPAQEGDRVPAARLPRKFCRSDVRHLGDCSRPHPGARRRRPLLQPRGDPDHPAHGRRPRRGAKVLVGRGGILSTPAVSCVIRKHGAFGGIVLSASHNPGGPDGDFGIKYNIANGGPAPEKSPRRSTRTPRPSPSTASATRRRSTSTAWQHRARGHAGRGDRPGGRLRRTDGTPVRLRRHPRAVRSAASRMRFDGMHAVSGPTPRRSSKACSARPAGTVINGEPLEDFGGHHPDPNPVNAAELIALMAARTRPTSAPRRTATATAT
jgi:hypothetical protein